MSESGYKNNLINNFKYKDIIINEKRYLIGVQNTSGAWHILLTDLVDYYEEKLSKEEVLQKCEDYNPLLVDTNYEEIISEVFSNIPKYSVSCTVNCINLEYKIEDGKFSYSINLTNSNSENFHRNFTANLYFSFAELFHRYNYLLEIVNKKDQEIDEYKAQGVELLRKSLITEPFTEKVFESKLKNTYPVNKLDIFLKALNFYESLKYLQPNNDTIKQESEYAESESQFNTQQSKTSPETQKSAKRPSSSDIRCAVAPKLERKTKIKKEESKFQYL